MLKLNKKGFTVVELVIVIAVVAILAAVLIPTFVGLTRAANASADIQACRQMNTQLAINEVTKGKTIVDVYDALEAGGMTTKDYHPLVADTYFFWDSELNRVLYADKDNKVIYPEEYKDVKSKSEQSDGGHQWYSLSGLIDTSNATVNLTESVKDKTLRVSVSSAADLVKVAEYVSKNKSSLKDADITIDVTADINLNGADICFLGENDKDTLPNVTIKGNGKTITGLYISDKHVGVGNDAQGKQNGNYGAAMFSAVNNLTVKNLTIESSVAGSYTAKQPAFFAAKVYGKVDISNVTIKNSSVYGDNKLGLLFAFMPKDGYNVSISGVKIENSKVYTKGGEAGLLFGVVTGGSNSQESLAGCSISITGCSIDSSSEVVIKSDAVVEKVNGEECVKTTNKYRQARATYGFYGLNQGKDAATETTDGKKVTNWKAINQENGFIAAWNS